ncbi:MAG: ZIP family metal transporter, partial [Rikenellaceae bacterium]
MIETLLNTNPVLLALLATLFTWFMTALGSGTVFLFRTMNDKVMNMMLGFAAGVMIAASFWSLLQPAIELGDGKPMGWMPVVIGFLLGGAFLYGTDKLLPHLHRNINTGEGTEEGI